MTARSKIFIHPLVMRVTADIGREVEHTRHRSLVYHRQTYRDKQPLTFHYQASHFYKTIKVANVDIFHTDATFKAKLKLFILQSPWFSWISWIFAASY